MNQEYEPHKEIVSYICEGAIIEIELERDIVPTSRPAPRESPLVGKSDGAINLNVVGKSAHP